MDTADMVMLIVCVPLLIMVGILTYIVIALVLKEEFDKTIWPFNKEGE
ncbi:MAG: hypothetical protein IJ880_01835 [Bacilli bacterium]|nr:hypothetical protein [Bacilli bacterium]